MVSEGVGLQAATLLDFLGAGCTDIAPSALPLNSVGRKKVICAGTS